MKNIPKHLAQPAVSFVGAGLAMDEQINVLLVLLENSKCCADTQLAADLERAFQITKAIQVLYQKSILSGHALISALIQEVRTRL